MYADIHTDQNGKREQEKKEGIRSCERWWQKSGSVATSTGDSDKKQVVLRRLRDEHRERQIAIEFTLIQERQKQTDRILKKPITLGLWKPYDRTNKE